ncbi:RNA recognition domain-containing protein [Phlyctema vagabunda]|uniref:RNA recognition domain-containing protein n=1 Tax=Phlyctema vagabunda TaxID=108571 RepID=A0ABR4P911_9HELO
MEAATYTNRSTSMFAQTQAHNDRSQQDRAASYPNPQNHASQKENVHMGTLLNQFAGLNTMAPGAPAMNVGSNQVPMPPSQYYYTQDGQLLFAAPGMYQAPSLAPTQLAENSYNSYGAALPYLAQVPYHGYAGYQVVPYTPGRTAYYPDRAVSDALNKEVPGLENRRGSYSTTESTPGTPFYGSLTQREAATHIAMTDRSPFGSTPSPQQLSTHNVQPGGKPLPYKTAPLDADIDALIRQQPAIPLAVPAVFTPRENMRTLDQSLSNPIYGNRNVYIRGLHPNTDDETLAAYAARFGKVETSKAIIDTSTGACKGFGFAKYFNVRDSELCIRGFYKLGYEVGFARESFNSRLKAEGDVSSTNLYVSNLPKDMTESELGAIFMDYTVSSSRILRDSQNHSRGVGFARFESREICEEIIKKFHGQPIGEEGLLLQVRYADTQAQKDLKRITTERRQFRTNEYNVGAYGGSAIALSPPMASPVGPRADQIRRHMVPQSLGRSWKRETSGASPMAFKDLDYVSQSVMLSLTQPSPKKAKDKQSSATTPTISEDGSADDGVTIHCDSPAVVHGTSSPSARKA